MRFLPVASILATIAAIVFSVVPASVRAASAPSVREATVLHMSDTHAALRAHPEIFFDPAGKPVFRTAGGYALLAAAIRGERASRPGQTMLVNVGDTLHGSAVAEWSRGKALLPVVNALGIDVTVPGNWDFAYGPEAFRGLMQGLNHPVAVANVHDAATGQRLFAPSVVREVNGVRIAVVGISSVIVHSSMAPDFSRGLRFTFKEGIQAEVDRLRREGVEVVLLATELGLAQEVRLAREIRGVDLILGGHTHERTYQPVREGGTPVIQSGSEGSFLGRVTFRVQDGRVVGFDHELVEVTADRYRPEGDVERLVDAARAPWRERLERVVGHTDIELYRKGVLESSTDNLLADAVRAASGADIGMTNGFRFSYPVLSGAITEEDLYNIFPMEAPIKVGRMTGRQLRAFWEDGMEQVFAADPYGQRGGWGPRPSGMEIRVRLGAPRGQRVLWMKVGGRTVRDDDVFTVATCDRPGDPADVLCRFPGATQPRILPLTVHEALRAYLRGHDAAGSRVSGRVSAEDTSGHVWSQYELGTKGAVRQ